MQLPFIWLCSGNGHEHRAVQSRRNGENHQKKKHGNGHDCRKTNGPELVPESLCWLTFWDHTFQVPLQTHQLLTCAWALHRSGRKSARIHGKNEHMKNSVFVQVHAKKSEQEYGLKRKSISFTFVKAKRIISETKKHNKYESKADSLVDAERRRNSDTTNLREGTLEAYK